MILTDYFRSDKDLTWDIAKSCGVTHGTIRLPEHKDFDLTDKNHWQSVYDNFINYGITPVNIEPMPNCVHDHIKTGDNKRDECIEKVIKMFPIMRNLGIDMICFNWMAYIGWLRTRDDIPERGGAKVTGFNMHEFKPISEKITKEKLWENYEYFLKAVIDEAEKYEIKLALHPEDPPVPKLGEVERIMISADNIKKAVYDVVKSERIGITMCQANFYIMGEDLDKVIKDFKEKIFFIHFRNTTGNPLSFRETYHDNGDLNMAHLLRIYKGLGINVPIRVDHVPTLKDENTEVAGYAALGRYFALGYLKGLLGGIQ